MSYTPRLKEDYSNKIVNELKDKLQLDNIMQVPVLEKIVISRGVGAAVSDKKLVDHAVEELTLISGQKAIATLSKKDVASFKLRKGSPIGAKVTLRGERMYEFLDRHTHFLREPRGPKSASSLRYEQEQDVTLTSGIPDDTFFNIVWKNF